MKIFNMGNRELRSGDVFGRETNVSPVWIVIGVVGYDTGGLDPLNPLERGRPLFDEEFSMFSEAQYEAVLDICQEARLLTATRNGEVQCGPWEHFKAYVLHPDVYGSWPLPDSTVFFEQLQLFRSWPSWGREGDVCEDYLAYRNINNVEDLRKCYAFLETGQEYISPMRYFERIPNGYRNYIPYREHNEKGELLPLESTIPYVFFSINATLDVADAAYKSKPIYESLEAFIARMQSKHVDTAGLRGMWQTSAVWPQLISEEEMARSAYVGVALSSMVAGLAILFFSDNSIAALIGLLSISCICANSLGLFWIAGWDYGFVEAVCTVLSVGFSVDFSAHILLAYMGASGSRTERTKEALGTMGSSILSGAMTTLGAICFATLSILIPFSKAALFICFNMFLSFVFAVTLVPILLLKHGPREVFELGPGRQWVVTTMTGGVRSTFLRWKRAFWGGISKQRGTQAPPQGERKAPTAASLEMLVVEDHAYSPTQASAGPILLQEKQQFTV
jgi:hypothetical protein